MLARTVLLALSASVSLVAAQGQTHTEFSPDTAQVPEDAFKSWCPSELAVCPQICGGAASPNNCFAVGFLASIAIPSIANSEYMLMVSRIR
jgi:hypothetical protein